MSRPERFTSDTPIGKVYSASGTSPLTPYSRECSMNMTGLSDRIAVFSRPLASYGVDGMTTSRPGTWANQASRLCEWVAASCPQPAGVRITRGTLAWLPNMEWIFAALLTIWSIATRLKLIVISSATGRRPPIAAPTAVPMIASSAIGVSRIRLSPNSPCNPRVTA